MQNEDSTKMLRQLRRKLAYQAKRNKETNANRAARLAKAKAKRNAKRNMETNANRAARLAKAKAKRNAKRIGPMTKQNFLVREAKNAQKAAKNAEKATARFQRILNKTVKPPKAKYIKENAALAREAKNAQKATARFQRILNKTVKPPKAKYIKENAALAREAAKNAEKATARFQRILNKTVKPPKATRKVRSNKGKTRPMTPERLNREAARIGRFLNQKRRIPNVGRVEKAKYRSNKGILRGSQATIEKRRLLAAAKEARKAASEKKKLENAKKAANREARRLEKVMAAIRIRRSLTNDQKAQALVNQATMSAKNLKAKYIVVQKREKKATNAVKNVVQQVVNAVASAAPKKAAPKRRRRSANANIAAQNVVTTGRRTRSRK
ncbi:hypothetical protein DSLPV1_187 [Dishui lake phycodnavirus 1]|uniref:hypothetical protein n=1 Tax=Dishui lake phycodnavirus 1 TaxID=2079134 RepID=UPI000CD6B402|nr:hypothetical protein C5Y57_gp211 [Dishui lake phycodnavirus 1]AUT19158.1 hypothetical protein DSLPV1_187 [Dishui lake phycodnavirus 1]